MTLYFSAEQPNVDDKGEKTFSRLLLTKSRPKSSLDGGTLARYDQRGESVWIPLSNQPFAELCAWSASVAVHQQLQLPKTHRIQQFNSPNNCQILLQIVVPGHSYY